MAHPSKHRLQKGLTWPIIIALALLGVPRAVGHDIDLLDEGTLLNALFVFVPFIIWIAVVLIKKVPKPFRTLLIIGTVYGLFLALAHQLNWEGFWGDSPPSLEGNLKDRFSPGTEELLLRIFAFFSSVVSGIVTGAVLGIAAVAFKKAIK